MKKISLLFSSIVCFGFALQAQKVGINVPSPTENLHIDSTIKIGKNSSINTSTPGRKNLLKFGDENYVTIGEEQGDDKLYIRYGDLIFNQSTGSVGNGYIGIKTEAPTATLDVNGTFRLRSGAPAAGKVLTSDANGNATWQTPSATNGIGFSATLTNSLFLVSNVAADLGGFTENFDDGNVFNPSNGRFTAPSDGVYQFTYNLNFTETGTDTKYLNIVIKRGGGTTLSFSHISPGINSNWSSSYTNTFLMKLDQGDYINLSVNRSASAGNELRGGNFANATFFQGHKLY